MTLLCTRSSYQKSIPTKSLYWYFKDFTRHNDVQCSLTDSYSAPFPCEHGGLEQKKEMTATTL